MKDDATKSSTLVFAFDSVSTVLFGTKEEKVLLQGGKISLKLLSILSALHPTPITLVVANYTARALSSINAEKD